MHKNIKISGAHGKYCVNNSSIFLKPEDTPVENFVNYFRNNFTDNMTKSMSGTKEFKSDFPLFLLQGEAIIRQLDFSKTFKDYEIVGSEIAFYEHLFENFHFKGFIAVFAHFTTSRHSSGLNSAHSVGIFLLSS